MRIWYYKPWSPIRKVPAHLVFDGKDRQMIEVLKTESQNVNEDKHPLDSIHKHKIRTSMVEIPYQE